MPSFTPNTIVVHAHGDIDLSTAPALRHEIAAAIWSHPATVVIDLAQVEFMDSACANAVAASITQAEQAGVLIEIDRPDDHVARVLDICGVPRRGRPGLR